jgi:hypothetical protein
VNGREGGTSYELGSAAQTIRWGFGLSSSTGGLYIHNYNTDGSYNNAPLYLEGRTALVSGDLRVVGGNLGVATMTPRAPLDVATLATDTITSILARLTDGNNVGKGTFLGVHAYNTTLANSISFSLEHRYYSNLNSAINFYRGGSTTGGFITFTTNSGIERMRLDANGNVGIGTTATGTYKLAVEGTIGARKLQITQATWADYVFKSDYQLPSLKEIEQYINTNKHLSGVPTESVVLKEGIDVGEMNKVLLQKVEELTLLLINEHKENEAKMKALECKVEMLEKKVKY